MSELQRSLPSGGSPNAPSVSFGADHTTGLYLKEPGVLSIALGGGTGRLEIEGEMKVTGGSPGVGKFLVDLDGTGFATWALLSAAVEPLISTPKGTDRFLVDNNGAVLVDNIGNIILSGAEVL